MKNYVIMVYEMVKDRVDWNDHAAASHEKVY